MKASQAATRAEARERPGLAHRSPVLDGPRRRAAFARVAALPGADAIALAAAVLLTRPTWSAAGYAAAVLVVARLAGAHRLRICPRAADDLPWLVLAVVAPFPLLAEWTGGVLVSVAGASLLAMRLVCYATLRAVRRRGWLAEPAVIVGTGALGSEIAALLCSRPELGLRPVGFVDHLAPGPGSALPLLGGLDELPEIVARLHVLRVIVCFPAAADAALVPALRAGPAEVCVVPRLYELGTVVPARYRDEIHGIPLVTLRRGPRRHAIPVKRLFDLVVSAALLVLCSPVLAVLMATLLLRHGRPVLFRQVRVSLAGNPVVITKLRTLTDPCPDTTWAVPTAAGCSLHRWLRATHVDELPQLWSVLRGELSLVGPRPERPHFVARFARTIPRYADRHRMPAGLTGWAQVHGLHGDTSISQRVRFDNSYIEHWSLWTDMVILVRTLATPIAGLRRYHQPAGGKP